MEQAQAQGYHPRYGINTGNNMLLLTTKKLVSNAQVRGALDALMRDRTTFVIAHRLSTVRNATRILVFDHGRIVETGTFDELVRRGGVFTELARAQFLIGLPIRAVTADLALALHHALHLSVHGHLGTSGSGLTAFRS